MRMPLVLMLAFLAQWVVAAHAKQQAGRLPGWPATTNGRFAHPTPERLFFFTADPKNTGQPVTFGQPQVPATSSYLRLLPITNPLRQKFAQPTPKFPPTGLIPLENLSQPNLWRFLKPKKAPLFFFSQPR